MIRRRLFVALFAVLAGASPALAATAADPASPEAILKGIYAAYGQDKWPDDPEGHTFSPALLKRYQEITAGGGDDPELGIDFDVFIDAQDVEEVQKLKLTTEKQSEAAATVEAKFAVFGEDKDIHFSFVKTAAGWKIDDIDWGGEEGDLRSLLDQLEQEQKAAAEAGNGDNSEDDDGN